MKYAILLLAFIAINSVALADGVGLYVRTNTDSIRWDELKDGDRAELVVGVYLVNNGTGEITVIAAPHKAFNPESLKLRYWYALEGIDGRLVVPNTFLVQPICVPKGAAVKIEEWRMPAIGVPNANVKGAHSVLKVTYTIEPLVSKYLAVWTGTISTDVTLK